MVINKAFFYFLSLISLFEAKNMQKMGFGFVGTEKWERLAEMEYLLLYFKILH